MRLLGPGSSLKIILFKVLPCKEDSMKASRVTCVTGTTLCMALATPVRRAAQKHEEEKTQNHRHRLADIGTFGGPEGFINGSGNGAPQHHLCPTGLRIRVLLQPPNLGPVEFEVHLPQTHFRVRRTVML